MRFGYDFNTLISTAYDEFIRHVHEMHNLQSAEAAKVQQKQFAQSQKRHRELDSLIKQLYEDKVKGELSAKRFEILSGEYESEQEDLERQIAELQEELAAFDTGCDNAERFIRLIRRYTEIPELTGTILNEYIDKILVHEADRSTGRREQDVDIFFNFIGQFALPGQLEPEPFDPVAHQKEVWRRNYHRSQERFRELPPEIQEEKRERQREYARGWRRKRREEKDAIKAEQTKNEPAKVLTEEEIKRENKLAYQREYHRDYG